MDTNEIMRSIAEHVLEISGEIDKSGVQRLVEEIKKADRIFVYGAGRSGLAARAFAMRLVQLGLTSYVIGETVTPSLDERDFLILVSGSGETDIVLGIAKTAKNLGVRTASITSYPNSTLGILSDFTILIRGKEKADIQKEHLRHQIEGVHSSLTPLGTLFEDTTLIFLDGIIGRLMVDLNKNEAEMKRRHSSV
jgi:6-phospho-3-hexuloisomerase